MRALIVLASIPRSISQASMPIKSDKTFEDIVERLVALVGPAPAGDGAKADSHEDQSRDQPEDNGAPPSAKTPFDHKKR